MHGEKADKADVQGEEKPGYYARPRKDNVDNEDEGEEEARLPSVKSTDMKRSVAHANTE